MQLTHDDEVSLWIGRAARAAAEVDYLLLRTFLTLAGPDSWPLYPRNSGATVDSVRALLKEAEMPEDLRSACLTGLHAMRAALKKRNDAVHGYWYQDQAAITATFVQQPKPGRVSPIEITWNVGQFQDVVNSLRRASLMGSSLMCACEGRRGGTYSEPSWRLMFVEILNGHFRWVDDTHVQYEMTKPGIREQVAKLFDA